MNAMKKKNLILDILILGGVIAVAIIGYHNHKEYERIKEHNKVMFEFQGLMMERLDIETKIIDSNLDDIHRRLDRQKIK